MKSDYENRSYEVYMHTNRINGKAYIGITCNGVRHRLFAHESLARHGGNLPFHRAIRKYGIEAFDTVVLAVCNGLDDARKAEREFIAIHGTFGLNGYNATEGGEGTKGTVQSPARRKEISEHFKAMHRSEQHCKRISASLSGVSRPYMAALNKERLAGKKQSDSRKAISLEALSKARLLWSGSEHTDQSKLAMRSAKCKQIKITKPSGEVELLFTTLRALAESSGISASALSQAAKHGRPIAKDCPLLGCILDF